MKPNAKYEVDKRCIYQHVGFWCGLAGVVLDWRDRVGSYCVESLWSGAAVPDRYGLMVGGLSCWIVSAGLVVTYVGLPWWQPYVDKQGMPFLTGGEGILCRQAGKCYRSALTFV